VARPRRGRCACTVHAAVRSIAQTAVRCRGRRSRRAKGAHTSLHLPFHRPSVASAGQPRTARRASPRRPRRHATRDATRSADARPRRHTPHTHDVAPAPTVIRVLYAPGALHAPAATYRAPRPQETDPSPTAVLHFASRGRVSGLGARHSSLPSFLTPPSWRAVS